MTLLTLQEHHDDDNDDISYVMARDGTRASSVRSQRQTSSEPWDGLFKYENYPGFYLEITACTAKRTLRQNYENQSLYCCM